MILQSLFLTLLLVYACQMVHYWWAWRKIPSIKLKVTSDPASFSVIVPVRNEAQNIVSLLQDLEKQTYPKNGFEVIVVDDHSEDATPELVRQFLKKSHLNGQLLFLSSFSEKRQKKAAVEAGISAAQGSWIACTDGDCRLPSGWLASINQVRIEQGARFISGPVVLNPTQGLFQDLQGLEFSGLIGVGAASIQTGEGTMCNGANLAYEKAAFAAVGGFTGNEHIASGDDEFLLHKIQQKYPGQVAFVKSREATVSTEPMPNVPQLLQQRIRWASKWRHYEQGRSKFLAVLVLGANIAVTGALVASLLQVWSWGFFWLCLLLKLLPDVLLLSSVLGFFEKKRLLWYIGLLQLVYLPYVLLTAFMGFSGRYHWKGRKHVTQ